MPTLPTCQICHLRLTQKENVARQFIRRIGQFRKAKPKKTFIGSIRPICPIRLTCPIRPPQIDGPSLYKKVLLVVEVSLDTLLRGFFKLPINHLHRSDLCVASDLSIDLLSLIIQNRFYRLFGSMPILFQRCPIY